MTSLVRCTRLLCRTSRPLHRSNTPTPRFYAPTFASLRPPTAHSPPTLHRTFSTTSTSSPPQPSASTPTYHLLLYRYVDNMSERRGPVRPLHLQHAGRYVQSGHLVLGGACPPEVKDAVLVFKGLDKAAVEGFAKDDPYVTKGLVEEWRVKEWSVVVGSAM